MIHPIPTAILTKWLPTPPPAPLRLVWTAPERKILRRPVPMRVSEWAERHRVIPADASVPGRWRNATVPYLAGIMDASLYETVKTIIVCAAPQTGKSEAVNTCLGYCADRRPGNVLIVYPDEDTAKDNSRDRLVPMFRDSRLLSGFLTGAADDEAAKRINLRHMRLYLAWANSASRLANKPLPYVVLDEIDKYPATAGKKESSPELLAEKRTRTFPHRMKIWKLSTPTVETGPIWVALTTQAQVVFDYHVRCPECGHLHLMDFDRICHRDAPIGQWPESDRHPEDIKARLLARYACPRCQSRWTDADRDEAARRGCWLTRSERVLSLDAALTHYRPAAIGFHLPSWVSPFVSLSTVMAAWFSAKGDPVAAKDFQNGHRAEPWRTYQSERPVDIVMALKDDRPAGLVPDMATIAGLTCAIDTQDNGFWYEIRAWGYGEAGESWMVRGGFVTGFAEIEQIVFGDQYKDAAGHVAVIRGTLIDSMGHRTAEVYDWCRKFPRAVIPLKGEQRMAQPHAWTRLDHYPGTGKPIPGGLALLRINTTFYKDQLAAKLAVAPADPGAWHLNAETPTTWAEMLCAETVNDKGLWEVIKNRPNHAWDLGVYGLALADLLGLKHRKPETVKPKPQEPPPATSKKQSWVGARKTGWMGS